MLKVYEKAYLEIDCYSFGRRPSALISYFQKLLSNISLLESLSA